MTSGRTAADQWSPLLTIRPPLDQSSDQVQIADAYHGVHASISEAALFDFVAATMRGEDPPRLLAEDLRARGLYPCDDVPAQIEHDLAHWWKRGWFPSLTYYEWSHRCAYADTDGSASEERRRVLGGFLQRSSPPPRILPEGERVMLPPAADLDAPPPLGDLLLHRRTCRRFQPSPVPLSVLSSILRQGLDSIRRTRVAAEAGDDPLLLLLSHGVAFDIYLAVFAVDGIDAGIYAYDVLAHELRLIRPGRFRKEVIQILWTQPAPGTAGWTLFLVADFAQYQWRYRHERALRNLYTDVGRVAHQLVLAAEARGCASFLTPALRDSDLCALLSLTQPRQGPLYSVTTGFPRPPQP